jgi:uncharacterized membrane protein (DUF4010 family)
VIATPEAAAPRVLGLSVALGEAVAVAVLLASHERLHLFAIHALSDAELHDALLLAALALALLMVLIK